MSDKHSAVGVFDSGLGGLTAIRQLKKLLPNENFIYFGDTGRIPYGTRSFETVIGYAEDDMRFLSGFDVKAALVACGTVSAIALDDLRQKFDLPITGAVEPASAASVAATKSGEIAVFATQATISKKAYEKEIAKLSSHIRVHSVACPMFVPLIEAGYVAKDCTVTRLIAAEYLENLKNTATDTLILGCTHYPLIRELISDMSKEILGRELNIIDSGYESARSLFRLLSENNLLNDSRHKGKTEYYVSDETQGFCRLASLFLGENVGKVTKVTLS